MSTQLSLWPTEREDKIAIVREIAKNLDDSSARRKAFVLIRDLMKKDRMAEAIENLAEEIKNLEVQITLINDDIMSMTSQR